VNRWIPIALPVCLLLLAACGGTSNVRTGDAAHGAPAAVPDITAYDRVVVVDFVDATDKSRIKQEDLQTYTDSVATATRTFADLIASKLRATGAFTEVVRGTAQGNALRISGRITRLTEGSRAARLLIGMGAGSSYFEATTDLTDLPSGASRGTIVTDKNSWALGGAIAASQNVQGFMDGAAKKISTDLATLKKGETPKKGGK
jgi:hypothetical protein